MSDATSRVPVPDNDLLDGRYRLIERLGHGGMATVWRGYDERLSRTVAVKVLDGPLLHDAAARTQILLEARALARLTHPHIAHVYDSGSTGDGVPYLVMELVDGPSLARVLATRQVLAWRTAVSVCAQVADALAAAHALGCRHTHGAADRRTAHRPASAAAGRRATRHDRRDLPALSGPRSGGPPPRDRARRSAQYRRGHRRTRGPLPR